MAHETTREGILKNAEELVSAKGLYDITISEIAGRAGVSDSVLYHYFKNKEDLVFSIAEINFVEAIQGLRENLDGILEPLSKLSKMIWFHLKFNQTHHHYPRIWLFECRANRNFYHHSAYQSVRKYAGIPLEILLQGVERGVFRADVNMRLVRDLIFGALDWETLQTLAAPAESQGFSDISLLMEHLSAMIKVQGRSRAEDSDKSLRIVEAAERLFSVKGFKETGIKEIARMANVAEGTVYEHFKKKEDILFHIPLRRFSEHLRSLTEVFEVKTPLKKLTRFIQHHFLLLLTGREFLKTFLLDLQLNPAFYETQAFQLFQDYCRIVDEILEEGKRDGSFRDSANAKIFKNLLFGGFNHVALRWLILDSASKSDRLAEMDETIRLLVRSVISDPADRD
jgi:TetR/AcrR family fatty acid metabolism transcriptional regulator